jgi:hypothetical protein
MYNEGFTEVPREEMTYRFDMDRRIIIAMSRAVETGSSSNTSNPPITMREVIGHIHVDRNNYVVFDFQERLRLRACSEINVQAC